MALYLLVLCVGCVGTHQWMPDTIYTEQSTYDFPNSTYHEVGLSGEIDNSGGVRFDVFTVTSFSLRGDGDHSSGLGIRFEIPLGGK